MSVVVPTRDRPDVLASCLCAVRRQGYSIGEIIVVDSAPRRADSATVAGRFGARYLRLDRPGLSRARNLGAQVATGDIIVFLDDDVLIKEGCLTALADEFDDDRTMIASGRVLIAGGDDVSRDVFASFGAFDAGTERRVVDRDTPSWFEIVNFGGLGTGAILAVRRQVYDFWGGFDERLGRGAPQDCSEELYAFFSIVDRGHRAVYSPRALALHPAPESLDALRKRLLASAKGAGAYVTLLFVEHAPYRMAVLRYVWDALRGRQRAWRPYEATKRHSVVPRWRERCAWLSGAYRYARMRLKVAMT